MTIHLTKIQTSLYLHTKRFKWVKVWNTKKLKRLILLQSTAQPALTSSLNISFPLKDHSALLSNNHSMHFWLSGEFWRHEGERGFHHLWHLSFWMALLYFVHNSHCSQKTVLMLKNLQKSEVICISKGLLIVQANLGTGLTFWLDTKGQNAEN